MAEPQRELSEKEKRDRELMPPPQVPDRSRGTPPLASRCQEVDEIEMTPGVEEAIQALRVVTDGHNRCRSQAQRDYMVKVIDLILKDVIKEDTDRKSFCTWARGNGWGKRNKTPPYDQSK